MNIYTLPLSWDARKFALRYNLNFNTDFYVNTNAQLVVFPRLPDDPPIFDVPDPPSIPLAVRLDAVLTVAELIPILKERLR